jgi:hypothetical protein
MTRWRMSLLGGLLLLVAAHGAPASAGAQAPEAAAEGALHVLVVVGLGGEPEYRDSFHAWAVTVLDAARDRFGVPEERLHYLGERPEMAPGRMQDRSTRENVAAAVREIAAASRPGDRVLALLIGHGTGQGEEAKFNLPGPDPTAADWAEKLEPLADRKLALVNAASASGAFLPVVAREGWIVVTATRSGRELNETVFARYFAEALASEEADLDKDGDVSLLEAFEYARQEVARFYREAGRIQTEFALIDDEGTGVGSRAPGVEGTDGEVARRFRFGSAASVAVAAGLDLDDPRMLPLLERRRALEDEVAALRARQDALTPAEYERLLEDLLVELALVSREIRELSGGGGR